MDVNEILKYLGIGPLFTALVCGVRLLGGDSDCMDVTPSMCMFISKSAHRVSHSIRLVLCRVVGCLATIRGEARLRCIVPLIEAKFV
jgi:hypothetical protein